ncbi:immunity 49 family protein [Nocardia yamanashiensis]|uniref:immunity 49 family protein n=1 Tax=Nocardia yamanashiensis TaxID=209247 RepID=UPI00082F28F3|nr:immunity 49 family protein [Nocardia yamanashiensis]
MEIADAEGEFAGMRAEIEEHLDRVEAHPRRMSSVLEAALWLAGLRSAVDPGACMAETWEAFELVMDASSAIFEVAVAAEGVVRARIGERSFSIAAGATAGYADAGNWATAFYFAVICRDQERLAMLSQVPIELLRATGAEFDGYIYHWVDALQQYWREEAGLVEALRSALEGADPEKAGIGSPELMLEILYPPINLFYRFLAEDLGEFNAGLVQALESHDRYWNSDEHGRRHSRIGMVAAGPLAMACLACDAGLAIEVKSEYLPQRILNRL